MDRFSVGLLLVMVVVLLSTGSVRRSPHELSDYPPHPDFPPHSDYPPHCRHPELLFSHLEPFFGNSSSADIKLHLKPIFDIMPDLDSLVPVIPKTETALVLLWLQACRASDPENQAAQWRALAMEVNKRMLTDLRIRHISISLFGEKYGPLLVNPDESLLGYTPETSDCVFKMSTIYDDICGSPGSYAFKYGGTFEAFCRLGVEKDAFVNAVSRTCQGLNMKTAI